MTTRLVALFDRMAPPLAGGSVPFKDATHRTSRGLSCALSLLVLLACPAGAAELLFVVRDVGSLSTQDTARVTQFVAWGHTVTLIDDSDSQANFDTALATAEVVYVTEEVSSAEVGYKLRETTVGVVSEEQALLDELGLATASSDPGDHGTLSVIDNSHPITSAFSVGSVSFSSPDADVSGFDVTLAPDLHVLGNWSSTPAIGVIEAGETLVNTYNGSDIALGRRVGIPLGSNFDWGDLTADGLLLLQNAVTWAVGTGDLIVHWKFDETSGDAINDGSLGSAADATVNSGVTPVAPLVGSGGGYQFSTGSVTPGNNVNDLDSGGPWDKRTVSLWFRADTVSGRQVLYSEGGTTRAFLVYIEDGLLYAAAQNRHNDDAAAAAAPWGNPPVYVVSTESIVAGKVYNVVAVLDGNFSNTNGSLHGYLNGEEFASTTGIGGFWPHNQAYVGRSSNLFFHDNTTSTNNFFSGVIDDVKIWNGVPSDQFIREQYLLGHGLIGHWKLDETSGTVAADSSGFGNDGAFNGSADWSTEGIRIGAVDVDGSESVEVPAFSLGGSTLSLGAWAKPETLSNEGRLLMKSSSNSGADQSWGLTIDDTGDVELRVNAGGSLDRLYAYGAIAAGRWQQVLGTYDGTTMRLYIDGALASSQAHSVGGDLAENAADVITIGNSPVGGREVDGLIDDVVVYNRVMTEQEIAEHYGLIGHWDFDEGSGTTVAESTGVGSDATFSTGTPEWIDGVRGKALKFDGTNDAQTDDDFDPPETGAVAFWYRRDGDLSDQERPFGLGGDWEARQEVGGRMAFDLGSSPYVGSEAFQTTSVSPDPMRWRHIVAQFVAETDAFEVYVDGQLDTSGTNTRDMVKQAAAKLSFGARTGSTQRFNGALDDFRIYNRWLDDAEIAKLYGLVGHWKLDETSGSVAADSSGMGQDGTINSSPTMLIDGPRSVESAMKFDGLDDHVILPTYDLDFSDGFAMSTWARPTSSAYWARFMELGNGPSADNIVFARYQTSNDLRVHVFHGSSVTGEYEASGALANDVWRLYAVSTDAQGDYDIYVDGVRVETLSGVLPQSLSRTDNYIGRSAWSSDDYYKGDLTDVRLYNRPITPEEARALYYGEYTPGLRIVRWVEVANP